MDKTDFIRITILGYTEVGKTYYMASLGELFSKTGPEGFKISDHKILSSSLLTQYRNQFKFEGKKLPTTKGMTHSILKLSKSNKEIMKICITDVEGQALEQDMNVEIGKKILYMTIEKSDGLILMIKAPLNDYEIEKAKLELHQMLNIASKILIKRSIPVAFVINQIDRLVELKKIEEKNKYIKKKVASNPELLSIVREFEIYAKNTNKQFPNGIFLTSNFGFKAESLAKEVNEIDDFEKYRNIVEPFGGSAAFLWLIYEYLVMKAKSKISTNLAKKMIDFFDFKQKRKYYENISNKLLKDIRYIYSSGKAFFDEDDIHFNANILKKNKIKKELGLRKIFENPVIKVPIGKNKYSDTEYDESQYSFSDEDKAKIEKKIVEICNCVTVEGVVRINTSNFNLILKYKPSYYLRYKDIKGYLTEIK